MPSKPTPKHVLRSFREMVKMPQKRFAEAIGVPALTYRFYETGRRKMPRAVAIRAFVMTGIPLAEIERGASGRLLTNFGERYTVEFYETWRTRFMIANERVARSATADISKWVEVLLLGSVRLGADKLHAVIAAIVSALDAIRADFQLAHKVDGLLREGSRPTWRPTSFHHEHHIRLGEAIASGKLPTPSAAAKSYRRRDAKLKARRKR